VMLTGERGTFVLVDMCSGPVRDYHYSILGHAISAAPTVPSFASRRMAACVPSADNIPFVTRTVFWRYVCWGGFLLAAIDTHHHRTTALWGRWRVRWSALLWSTSQILIIS